MAARTVLAIPVCAPRALAKNAPPGRPRRSNARRAASASSPLDFPTISGMRTASGEPMTNEPKATHTPGPWRVLPTNDCVIESEKHGNIALVNLARMSSADARLIAAAPDLLALAKRYASECADAGLDNNHILEVIRKAQGK